MYMAMRVLAAEERTGGREGRRTDERTEGRMYERTERRMDEGKMTKGQTKGQEG